MAVSNLPFGRRCQICEVRYRRDAIVMLGAMGVDFRNLEVDTEKSAEFGFPIYLASNGVAFYESSSHSYTARFMGRVVNIDFMWENVDERFPDVTLEERIKLLKDVPEKHGKTWP